MVDYHLILERLIKFESSLELKRFRMKELSAVCPFCPSRQPPSWWRHLEKNANSRSNVVWSRWCGSLASQSKRSWMVVWRQSYSRGKFITTHLKWYWGAALTSVQPHQRPESNSESASARPRRFQTHVWWFASYSLVSTELLLPMW